jgi:hypothetical protein
MNEDFYDSEIAPQLFAIAEACKARGISFVATVEYDPGEFGTTGTIEPHSERLKTAYQWLITGNIDAVCISLAERAKKEGHSSMVLSLMGVKPHENATGAEGK